ncbi:MAG: MaoC family dehydratase [Bacteroidota bacterium]
MPPPDYALDTLDRFVGRDLGVSGWVTVDQARIDAFAACTEDHQWIHTDPERAARESPSGTTIAHGFLTLSLLPAMRREVGVVPDGVARVLNYGLDRVRFLAPVPSGARVRARVRLASVTPKAEGPLLLKTENIVEIEGEETPALVAETLALLIPT